MGAEVQVLDQKSFTNNPKRGGWYMIRKHSSKVKCPQRGYPFIAKYYGIKILSFCTNTGSCARHFSITISKGALCL